MRPDGWYWYRGPNPLMVGDTFVDWEAVLVMDGQVCRLGEQRPQAPERLPGEWGPKIEPPDSGEADAH